MRSKELGKLAGHGCYKTRDDFWTFLLLLYNRWSRLLSGAVDANTSILFLMDFLACWKGHHGTPKM